MKYLTIIMFIFLINVSASLVNTIQLIEGYSIQPNTEYLTELKTTVNQDEYFQSAAAQQANSNFGFGDILLLVKGFALFVGLFARGVFVVPYTYIQFGLDPIIATILSLPVYFLYGLALTQFISKNNTKGMD